MAIWPFQSSRANLDADRLLLAVSAVSRQPALFAPSRIPDTLRGRFEAMALLGSLAMIRLRVEPNTEALAQAFTDKLFSGFDAGLREAGTGDLAVAKRMRGLAGSFYGRLAAYSTAIEASDAPALARAIGRNVFGEETHPAAGELASYALGLARTHTQGPLESMFEAEGWPPFSP